MQLVATLAAGLRENSRIKTKLAGVEATRVELLLAAAVDKLSYMVWGMTEDAQRGINRPKSVLEAIMGQPEKRDNTVGFAMAEDFESEWARITGVKHG